MAKTAMSRDPRKGSKPSSKRRPNAERRMQREQQKAQQTSANLYNQLAEYYKNFNPQQMAQQAQPGFTQGMQQAGDALYNEYMRRAEPELQRQQQATQQSLVERGLDPRGEAYKDAMMQLAQQQNDIRLAAQSRAAQEGAAYQQQLFGQAQAQAMMPAQLAQAFSGPMQSFQEYQQQMALQKPELANRLAIARMANRGGGGGGMDPMQAQYINSVLGQYEQNAAQGQQPGAFNQGINAFLSALPGAIAQGYKGS